MLNNMLCDGFAAVLIEHFQPLMQASALFSRLIDLLGQRRDIAFRVQAPLLQHRQIAEHPNLGPWIGTLRPEANCQSGLAINALLE